MSSGSGSDTACVAAFVTVPSQEIADKIASGLVEQKLVACVNILPGITSVYRWQGKVERDSELLLMIKTQAARVDAVSEYVRKVHPYDTPEVIALPITAGLPEYLAWIKSETTTDGDTC